VSLDEYDPDWWAVQFWLSHGLAFRSEEVTRLGLQALIDAVGDDLLGYVGAGPLENYVGPIEDRIRWIEHIAELSPRFRKALANVYAWGAEEDWVSERLERAARVPLLRPQ